MYVLLMEVRSHSRDILLDLRLNAASYSQVYGQGTRRLPPERAEPTETRTGPMAHALLGLGEKR